jgi:hypothetical protein
MARCAGSCRHNRPSCRSALVAAAPGCAPYGIGANVLMVTPIHDGSLLAAVPDSAWGLHVDDPNLAAGNLVDLVQSVAAAYISAHRPAA